MYVTNSKRLTLAGAKKMMETATAKAEAGRACQWRSPSWMPAATRSWSSAWTAAAFTPCTPPPPRRSAPPRTSGPRRPKALRGKTSTRCTPSGLALAAGAERWTAMEGGYPILFDGECVGGIGVSGATWDLDDQLAREAVEAIGATWKIDNK